MTARAAKDTRHEVMVIQAKLTVAQLVSAKPLAKMSRAQVREVWQILLDAAVDVGRLEDMAPAPRKGRLALAAEDGELTDHGREIVEQRAAERERRRQRRAERAASV